MPRRNRRGHGGGTITQLPDGRWQGRISLGETIGADGKRKRNRKAVYGKTRKEAEKKLEKVRREYATGRDIGPTAVSVEDFLDEWLESTKQNLSPTTWRRREQVVRMYIKPHLGTFRLQKLKRKHVKFMLTRIRKSEGTAWTVKVALSVLSVALAAAVEDELIPHNSAKEVKAPKVGQKEMVILNDEQMKQFLAAASRKRLYALFALAVGSGMRQGEILALAWPDVDFIEGTVKVRRSLIQVKGEFRVKEPKSESGKRTIKLPRFVLDSLHEHRKAMLAEGQDVQAGPVFVTKTGSYIEQTNLRGQVFEKVLAEANVAAQKEAEENGTEPKLLPKVRFHDLRHSHASALLRNGQSIKAVSKRLGHADPAMTLRVYAHVIPDEDEKLAECMDRMIA